MVDEVQIEWKNHLEFEYSASDQSIFLDAPSAKGGEGRGISPKQLLLVSLAGCTGMDVAAILKNYDCKPGSFKIQVSAIQEGASAAYRSIHINYRLAGADTFNEIVIQAVKSSIDHYCSIGKMLQNEIVITYEINFNENMIFDSRR